MKRSLKVDPMGRVVLPAAWRRTHGVEPGMYLRVEEDSAGLRLAVETATSQVIEEDGVLVHLGRLEGDPMPAVDGVRAERDRRNWGLEG